MDLAELMKGDEKATLAERVRILTDFMADRIDLPERKGLLCSKFKDHVTPEVLAELYELDDILYSAVMVPIDESGEITFSDQHVARIERRTRQDAYFNPSWREAVDSPELGSAVETAVRLLDYDRDVLEKRRDRVRIEERRYGKECTPKKAEAVDRAKDRLRPEQVSPEIMRILRDKEAEVCKKGAAKKLCVDEVPQNYIKEFYKLESQTETVAPKAGKHEKVADFVNRYLGKPLIAVAALAAIGIAGYSAYHTLTAGSSAEDRITHLVRATKKEQTEKQPDFGFVNARVAMLSRISEKFRSLEREYFYHIKIPESCEVDPSSVDLFGEERPIEYMGKISKDGRMIRRFRFGKMEDIKIGRGAAVDDYFFLQINQKETGEEAWIGYDPDKGKMYCFHDGNDKTVMRFDKSVAGFLSDYFDDPRFDFRGPVDPAKRVPEVDLSSMYGLDEQARVSFVEAVLERAVSTDAVMLDQVEFAGKIKKGFMRGAPHEERREFSMRPGFEVKIDIY